MGNLLCTLGRVYLWVLFGRIILSWFPLSPGSPMASVFSVVYQLTEPILGPVRRVIPPMGMGGMGIDLSPLIVILGYQILILPLICSFG